MTVNISAKSAYAPIRYQSTRPWWKKLGMISAELHRQDESHKENFIQSRFMPAAYTALIRESRIHVADHKTINKELELTAIMGRFFNGGRAIYDFSERLTDNLLITDFSDTTIGDVLKTDLSIYIHFGKHPGLHFERTQYEGAWIEYIYSLKQLSIYPARVNALSGKPGKHSDDDTIDEVSYEAKSDDQTIASMFDSTMSEVELTKTEMLETADTLLNDLDVTDRESKLELMNELFPEIDDFTQVFQTIHTGIFNLCMSAICYLTAKPEEIDYGWPKDAPANTVTQASNRKDAGRRATAEKTLENDGYIKIGYVGAKYNTMYSGPRIFTPGASESEIRHIKSTHPRRGFFRRQRVGHGRTDIKVVYVSPTLVNPGTKIGVGKVFSVK